MLLMGDFNVVLNMDERVGSPVRASEIREFRECVEWCGVGDIKSTGDIGLTNKRRSQGYF